MNYVLIEDNKVVKTRLPKVGTLKSGSTVSNYHLLTHDVLLAEGWLPLVDELPEVEEGFRAVHIGYDIYEDRVEVVYEIKEIIPPSIQTEDLIEQAKGKAQLLSVKSLIQSENLSGHEVLDVAALFPAYEVGTAYSIGDIFTYKRSLYEVIQEHKSQADWPPDTTASLYKNHAPKGETEEWRQPLGAHDAYMTGDSVLFSDHTYVSKIDNNVWSPAVYGWELEEDGYKEWVQPYGAHDAYPLGAIVTHNGKLWISTANANVWEPGAYGWNAYTE